jgi:two-component system, NarL family, sensor histidine kinase LiaS
VKITLNSQESWAKLSVEDNGIGIGPDVAKPNSLGLTSMRERVEQLGGHFEIGPNPSGSGALVRVGVPCQQ